MVDRISRVRASLTTFEPLIVAFAPRAHYHITLGSGDLGKVVVDVIDIERQ